jgi:hypothetical protein
MHGIILNRYWNRGTDPLPVTAKGTLAQMRATTHVDPTNEVDNWSRSSVTVVGPITVRSDDTNRNLGAQICRTAE